jgi:hypothetical protein
LAAGCDEAAGAEAGDDPDDEDPGDEDPDDEDPFRGGETLIVSAAAPSLSLATSARWLMAVGEIGCPQAPQNRAPSSISASQCGQRDMPPT